MTDHFRLKFAHPRGIAVAWLVVAKVPTAARLLRLDLSRVSNATLVVRLCSRTACMLHDSVGVR